MLSVIKNCVIPSEAEAKSRDPVLYSTGFLVALLLGMTMTVVLLSIPLSVQAQACPADQVSCDGECQAPDSKVNQLCQGPGGQQGTTDACGNCVNLTCPGQQILCSGNCQAQAAQCPPSSNRVYNQCTGCGECATGFTDCASGPAFNCQSNTSPSCASPATWDACTQTCTENYVRVSPTAAQSGFISMQGDLRSGGDVYLNNGRAIRIDGAGATELNLGNWAQGGAGADVFVWGNLSVGGPQFLRNLTVSGNLTVTGTINGLNLANAVLTTSTYANPAFITNLAWNKLTGFPGPCPAGPPQQFVTAIGGALTCAAPPAAGPGGITQETDPIYSQWFSSGSPTLTALTVGNISAATVSATGCFGAVYRGTTSGTFQGNVTYNDPQKGLLAGYNAVNERCSDTAGLAGSHVCTVEEILASISCGASDVPTSGIVWVQGGPPGFTATANDCEGWTNSNADALGRYWSFDANGGKAWLQPCNGQARAFACCR